MDRRGFLKLGAQLAGVSAVGSTAAMRAADGAFAAETHRAEQWHSVLDGAPGDSGIDTVVIVMMENRSFDSYLGWLGHETKYLERGRRRAPAPDRPADEQEHQHRNHDRPDRPERLAQEDLDLDPGQLPESVQHGILRNPQSAIRNPQSAMISP